MANARRASSPAPLWTRLELRGSESTIRRDHRSMSGHASARARRLGFSLVAAAAICWSTGGLITRLVTTDPWTTVFWRSVFCSAFLGAALAIANRGRLTALARETGWPGV